MLNSMSQAGNLFSVTYDVLREDRFSKFDDLLRAFETSTCSVINGLNSNAQEASLIFDDDVCLGMQSTKSIFSGGFGGVLVVLIGHPLDTIKVRLMTSEINEFSSMSDCVRKTVQRNGFRGLYAGMSAPLLTVVPIYASYFAAFDFGKALASDMGMMNETKEITFQGILLAGGISAVLGTLVMIPGDLVKVKVQVEACKPLKQRQFSGPLGCCRSIFHEQGIRGFFKGTGVTMVREIPSTMAYYAAYETIKSPLIAMSGGNSSFAIGMAGGLAGSCYTFLSVPADVLKSRFQTAPQSRYPGGMKQVMRELMVDEGIKGFFRGLTPALARNFPTNAACFLGIDACKRFLDKHF